ncbi:MAG: lysophospholipid acyltransferase family protein [Candidatus Omnitrophica bacterium]|nr:lysophospholipid acyltransferase family protein [Candidatus Omnitrophota bacterium]
MIFYILYRIGQVLALNLPLKLSYRVAVALADIHYCLGFRERFSVTENLKTILAGPSRDDGLRQAAKDVFRNFAKYLVDFFRFSKMDAEYVKRFIKMEGLSNIEDALKYGKGVIILSAHLGNWELGAFAMGTLGYPINAVVLTHRNVRINDFFKAQRAMGKLKSIEFGASLRGCYKALKNNELLALLGDRDFSINGLPAIFFGKPVASMPKGPAALSYRTGAAIVPSFITRNGDDTFTFAFEKPILPEASTGLGPGGPEAAGDEDSAIKGIMGKYLPVIESYVKRYPGQWYVFRNFWNPSHEELRTNTII